MELTYKLFDNHCHTEFAYCSTDVSARKAVDVAKAKNMEYVALTEHSCHLYFDRKVCWDSLCRPEMLEQSRNNRERIARYLKVSADLGSNLAITGFEVDADTEGRIILLEEDRQKAQVLVGGIHFLYRPGEFESMQAKKAESVFMDANEVLCKNGVDIIAHPFRIFDCHGLKTPRHLYRFLTEMLKTYNVAAELNFHAWNKPDKAFFDLCLAEGVKISTGSDSHSKDALGNFEKHIDFLANLGVCEKNFDSIVLNLKKRGRNNEKPNHDFSSGKN